MKELLKEYRQSLSNTRLHARKIEREIEVVASALSSSKGDEKISLEDRLNRLEEEKQILSGMASDLRFVIEWIRTGRQPGARRGIERRAAYERERPFDPVLMQRFFRSEEPVYEWEREEKESLVSRSDKEIINYALDSLTDREREVYLMSRGHCLSQYAIAEKIGLSRSSIKTMLNRADKKIANAISEIREEVVG